MVGAAQLPGGGCLSVEGPGWQERRDTAAQRDRGRLTALSPAAQLWSSSHGLAQEAETLKADLERDAWALSRPGWVGGGESWRYHCLPGP